jgi:eukaryotic-like serine/threonine-protein kinase
VDDRLGDPSGPDFDALRDTLAPLQLLERAASGGMGEIYLARDPALRRTLAVKVLRRELAADATARERFLLEARIIAGISHPNVIGIHSVGELLDRTPYYVMEYVVGGDLSHHLRSGRLDSVQEARRIVASIAAALSAAHAAGVIHLDVKPSNVLYDTQVGEPKLTDWGIAALRSGARHGEGDSPHDGHIAGSPGHMSPEQFEGIDVGPPSDIYGLGVLAFELLTGRRPFVGSTSAAIMAAQLTTLPPLVSDLRDDVDAEFADVISRCMSTNAAARPSAEEVLSRLDTGARDAIEWPPPGLDRLVGLGPQIGRRLALWLGVTTILATVLMERDTLARGDVAWYLAAIAACLSGGVLSVWTAMRSLPILRRVGRARASGYDWLTIFDVLADVEGDTGAWIAGSRSFGTLSSQARGRVLLVRRLRFLSSIALATAAASLLSTAMLRGPVLGSKTLLWFGAWMVAVAGLGRAWEWSRSISRRVASDRHRGRSPDLTDSWYRSLERLNLSRGRQRRRRSPLRTTASSLVVLASFVSLTIVGLPSLLVGFNGRFADAILTETLVQLDTEMEDDRRLRTWERLALSPESDTDGGESLLAALSAVNPDSPRSTQPPPLSARWGHPTSWSALLGPLGRSVGSQPTRGQARALRDSLFQLARVGFTEAQEVWIESLLTEPALTQFSDAARSRSINLSDHMWDPEAFVRAAMRGPAGSMPDGWNTLTMGKELEAALYLHRGAPDLADAALRESLSVALQLARHDPFWGRPAAREFGAILSRIAQLHEAQGTASPLATGIRGTLFTLGATTLATRLEREPYLDVSAVAIDMLAEGHGAPAHRLALARIAGLASRCGSIIEVARGPDGPTLTAMRQAQAQLAQGSNTRAYWSTLVANEPPEELIRASLQQHGISSSLSEKLIPQWVTRTTSALGNPRIRGCRWVLPLAALYLRL